MNIPVELYSLYRRLNVICQERGFSLEPEWGDIILYQGHLALVVAERGDKLAVIDDIGTFPINKNDVYSIENWKQESSCLMIPRVDQLVNIIAQKSSHFPVMTPGIEAAKEVWQITHPYSSNIITKSLEEALLTLAIRLLEENN